MSGSRGCITLDRLSRSIPRLRARDASWLKRQTGGAVHGGATLCAGALPRASACVATDVAHTKIVCVWRESIRGWKYE